MTREQQVERERLVREAKKDKQERDYELFLPMSISAIVLITVSTYLVVVGAL